MDIEEELIDAAQFAHNVTGCSLERHISTRAALKIHRLRGTLQQVLDDAKAQDVLSEWWPIIEHAASTDGAAGLLTGCNMRVNVSGREHATPINTIMFSWHLPSGAWGGWYCSKDKAVDAAPAGATIIETRTTQTCIGTKS